MSNNSSTAFTPKEIIELHKEHEGKLFKLDTEGTKTSADGKSMFIPFSCITRSGAYAKFRLKINNQLACSNAKKPAGLKPTDAIKKITVSYKRLTAEDLEISEYKNFQKVDLLKFNNELCDALDIISKEYIKMIKEQLMTYKGDKFRPIKKDCKIFNIVQTNRDPKDNSETTDEDGKVPLPVPIFRIPIPVDPKTNKVGKSYGDKGFSYVVFDGRKKTKETNYANIPARLVNSSKELVDLTADNIKDFLTYLSITTGIIRYDTICCSKVGISMQYEFMEIIVSPHPKLKNVSILPEEADEANSYAVQYDGNIEIETDNKNGFNKSSLTIVNEDDEDIKIDEPKKISKPKPVVQKDEEPSGNIPDDNSPREVVDLVQKKKTNDNPEDNSAEQNEDNLSDHETEEPKPKTKKKLPTKTFKAKN